MLEAKQVDPDCLCTFANYPPTEFLRPQRPDFLCFNVYLHQPQPFKNYLARLQMIADAKPLVLGEFGMDSLREGEAQKCEVLAWQIESAYRAGLAGTVIFSYTDDWFKGERQIEDWGFGLTARDRKPKESFWVVQNAFRAAPHFPLSRYPKVSVVVASFNGARTLKDRHHPLHKDPLIKGFEEIEDLPNLIDGLQRHGYKDEEIKLILGGNYLRVLKTILPERSLI